jgi:hypothetical protein
MLVLDDPPAQVTRVTLCAGAVGVAAAADGSGKPFTVGLTVGNDLAAVSGLVSGSDLGGATEHGGATAVWSLGPRQGLPLVHFSAEHDPFLSL